MNDTELQSLIEGVRTGSVDASDAVRQLRRLPFVDLGIARIDHHRQLRQGLPEAVYAPGKTPEQCAAIVKELLPSGVAVVLSRATRQQIDACPVDGAVTATGGEFFTAVWQPASRRTEKVLVVSAGTADHAVSSECVATLAAYGIEASVIRDCGVAGIHRLLGHVDEIADADAVVAIAGMEGALASVVGGLTSAPVVAVPTSVGYGSSLQGVTALLSMLSSCAAGISVVGIDNGYGAACAVMRILGQRAVTSRSASDQVVEGLPR
jgi:pyridinium-3,5-biscarboxylic acid mononucleotide synthase